MTYKNGLALDKEFTRKEQFLVVLISAGVGIGTSVSLRFCIKPIFSRYGQSTAAAATIIWYLVMGIGELVIINFVVLWRTPVQKIGVNLFWMVFDGPYCIYLGSKLMQ